MPFVTQLGSSPFQLGRIGGTKFVTPVADGFVREENAAKGPHQFHIPQTQGKVEIQPDALGNDLFRKPVTTIRVGWRSFSIASAQRDSAVRSSRESDLRQQMLQLIIKIV